MVKITAFTIIAAVCCGCAFERHTLDSPEKSQFVEVKSGDDWYCKLPEAERSQWSFSCDDPDVKIEVTRDVERKMTKLHLHIHRGYDGPSTVKCVLKNSDGEIIKTVNYGLFKRTSDEAFWK